MYKIVETIETGGKGYTVVPSNWEDNSNLSWPFHLKHAEIKKLSKNLSSAPEQNWVVMPCKVKATADSYLEAREIEKLYASFTDTEAEQKYNECQVFPKKRIKKQRLIINDERDYNADMEIIRSYETNPNNTNVMYDYEIENNNNNNNEEVAAVQEIVKEDNNVSDPNIHFVLPTLSQSDDINQLQYELKIVRQQQEDFVKSTTNEICGMQTKLDRILKHLSVKENNSSQWSKDDIVHTKDIVFPIGTIADITILNTSLLSKEFQNEMINRLSSLGGTTKVADGCKILYKVIDFMFTSELLNKFSWTGSSKSDVKKECFQKMANIVDLLYDVIFLADCRHSRQRNEEFLKEKILKHTAQRLKRKSNIVHEVIQNFDEVMENAPLQY